jgi:hypothetical protein
MWRGDGKELFFKGLERIDDVGPARYDRPEYETRLRCVPGRQTVPRDPTRYR